MDELQANKQVALEFIRAFNDGDLATLRDLLADDFVWNKPINREGETQPQPFQSEQLRGRSYPIPAFRDRDAVLSVLERHVFAAAPEDRDHLQVMSVTAEDDRVGLQVEGNGRNPANGRRYGNIYFVLMRVRDGKVVLYREYQDTMHTFDVWAAR